MRTDAAAHNSVDVLIADDDPSLRTVMRLLLGREGDSCVEAEQGEQAVELPRHRRPRCVFLDLAMPGLDGFSVARRLRADPNMGGLVLEVVCGQVERGGGTVGWAGQGPGRGPAGLAGGVWGAAPRGIDGRAGAFVVRWRSLPAAVPSAVNTRVPRTGRLERGTLPGRLTRPARTHFPRPPDTGARTQSGSR
jgi:CheY-like chemotaxis protein